MRAKGSGLMILGVWFLFFSACGTEGNGDSTEAMNGEEDFGEEVSFASAVNTKITLVPPNLTDSNTATFKFKCNKKKCAYKCKLDNGLWSSCKSPKTYSGLTDGVHTFKVKAKDKLTGKWDKTPALYSWTIFVFANAIRVSAGDWHTCGLTSEGGVKCWGWNEHGEIGDGTTADRLLPTNVSGLSSGITFVSAGFRNTCALDSSGAVKCWGLNDYGQLGDGTTANSSVPVSVSGLAPGVKAISSGFCDVCVITASGGAKCWGANYFGQLGDGTTATPRKVPVDVSGLTSGVQQISAGYEHTCAITSSGGAKCWGYDFYGQVGNEDTFFGIWKTPQDVYGLTSGTSYICTGMRHTCALTSTAGVKCWGSNEYGQVGDGSFVKRHVPVDVSGLTSQVEDLTCGEFHNCAMLFSGELKCWGWNLYGQLGDGTNNTSNVPVSVLGVPSGFGAMDGGGVHTCLLGSGRIRCWGYNGHGQIGDGTTQDRNIPTLTIFMK